MRLRLSLALPREAYSVPVTRRLLSEALEITGVVDEDTHDIAVALSEACANVLDHAKEGDDFEVVVVLEDDVCSIDVVDRGGGFDATTHGLADAPAESEGGRGILLMRRLVDRVHFDNRPVGGTVVHLEKHVRRRPDAPEPTEPARAAR